MPKFRFRGALALLAAFSIVAVACSDSSSSTEAQGSTSSSSATGAATVCDSVDTGGSDALANVCNSGELRIATDQKYKPQSWYDVSSGEWKGFDVDVATEIAKRLGVDPAIEHQDWSVVTAGSWNDRWDVSVGSMTDTVEREALFDFTPPYYFTPAGVAVYGDNTSYTSISDLSGKKVCAGEKTTYESYLEDSLTLGSTAPAFDYQISNPQVVTFKTDTDALDQLDLGDGVRCDAASSAVPTIQAYIDQGGNLKLLGDPIFYEPLCVAFDKNDPVDNASLFEAVSQIITEMHSDGTLSALSMEYYGADLTQSI
jgi:polar amino acid transport system substrate-binding protein